MGEEIGDYMNFEEAFEFSSKIGSPTSYLDSSLKLLWHSVSLAPRGFGLEIGCEFGRSTSMILQAAKTFGNIFLYGVDPFTVNMHMDVPGIFLRNMREINFPFVFMMMSSTFASGLLPKQFSFIHIDGDHFSPQIDFDCQLLYRLIPGGIAVFHDYGSIGTLDVKPTVDKATKGWEVIGEAETCYAVRKSL